ncbi:nuclear transport factor 2 family protein [Actinoplanes oblitus]|uniref:Nuclear transport factor 2 family protein n=1 Tax=Actinoplanes oblitus TaxID=3040509 RepID=A0ABY8WFH9_9ACTN|nr:nuclear transport factor 2 family protein [Actinoplanes oblitus]WIM95645.1 nuclear transport factor 2 family protein [Actinoplanes oblitus]
MTSLDAVTAWVDGYRRAWETNDPDQVRSLFADDAAYFTEPYAQPWIGREAIVRGWLEHRDEPGTTTFAWQPLIITDELAVIEGRTGYPDREYRNLWVLRLDHTGQARQFTEWWMEAPRPEA